MSAGYALLFTDLVDSTAMIARLGDAAASALLQRHDTEARDLLQACGGREIDSTDGFFLLFDSAETAVCYALAYQVRAAALGLVARVGVHVGPVALRDNDPAAVARGAKPIEVEGLAKPFAARVMGAARGGQTLLSAAARAALGSLPEGVVIECHGHWRLKGIEEPAELFEIGPADSAFEPPTDSAKAYCVVDDDGLWRPRREVPYRLPAQRDTFVGRQDELLQLARRLDGGQRLVTVCGPAGSGKTRLTCRYAEAWLGEWPGGVWFCDLSDATSLEGVHFAVAATLGVPLGRTEVGAQLGHAIGARGRCLLILDNFEQVTVHAAATVGAWLDRAREASFVVTSREVLHVPGEMIFAVEPLKVDSDAIELFTLRARSRSPGFDADGRQRPLVAEIVRLLDGLPLAIELAAARTRILSLPQLLQRMRDRFALLTGARGIARRQATLKAAIDWSWELLAPWEQSALAQCAVFEGGFTLEAAESVVDLREWDDAPPVMDAMHALVDKSLLRSSLRGERRLEIEEPYFGMYLSIREYAMVKLRAGGPAPAAAADVRHGRWFAAAGADNAIEALYGHGGARRRHLLALDIENLVAACRRAIARDDSATAVPLYRAAWEVLELKGPYAAAVELGDRLLSRVADRDASVRPARLARAVAEWRTGGTESAAARLEALCRESLEAGDRPTEALARYQLGAALCELGRPDEARAELEASMALAEAIGHGRVAAWALGMRALVHRLQGGSAEALGDFERAHERQRDAGDQRAEAITLGNWGNALYDEGRYDEAEALFGRAVAIASDVGDRRTEAIALAAQGNVQFERGRIASARELFERSLALDREIGARPHMCVVVGNLGVLLRDEGLLDEAQTRLQEARELAKEVGDRRSEGALCGLLGTVLTRKGAWERAATVLADGETLLRDARNPRELGRLLCARGQLDHHAGRAERAQAALDEAVAIAEATQSGSDSELAAALDRLRATLSGYG